MAIIEDLIVSEYGSFVGVKGRRLRVTVPEKPHVDAPLIHLRSVHILSHAVTVSASAIAACCQQGVPIYFIDAVEGNYAMLMSPHLTTVIKTRRSQLAAYHNATGVRVAAQIGAGKIRSQAANLRYLARRQEGESSERLRQVALELVAMADRIKADETLCLDDVREQFMGIEGQAARRYWAALGTLFPESYEWPGRQGRHAEDALNVLLNYGYGILYGEVQNALVIAGLEPYAGLLHTDRPGKPSLTLDLIEEFRAPIVDRTVVGLAKRNYTVKFDDNKRLEREFRKDFAEHILSRLAAQGMVNGKRYTLRSIIQMQARRLAAALRGEGEYEAYLDG